MHRPRMTLSDLRALLRDIAAANPQSDAARLVDIAMTAIGDTIAYRLYEDYLPAADNLVSAAQLHGSVEVEIAALELRAVALLATDDPAAGQAHEDAYQRAVELERDLDCAEILGNWWRLPAARGDFDEATRLAMKARAVYVRLNHRRGEGLSDLDLGQLAESQRDPDRAEEHYRHAIPHLVEADDVANLGAALGYLTDLLASTNRSEEAIEVCDRQIEAWRRIQPEARNSLASALGKRARLAIYVADVDGARRHFHSMNVDASGPESERLSPALKQLIETASVALRAAGQPYAERLDVFAKHPEIDANQALSISRHYDTLLGREQPETTGAQEEVLHTLTSLLSSLEAEPRDVTTALELAESSAALSQWLPADIVARAASALQRATEMVIVSDASPEEGRLLEHVSQLLRNFRASEETNQQAVVLARRALRIVRQQPHAAGELASALLTLANAVVEGPGETDARAARTLKILQFAEACSTALPDSEKAIIHFNIGNALLVGGSLPEKDRVEMAIDHLRRARHLLPPTSYQRLAIDSKLGWAHIIRHYGSEDANAAAAVEFLEKAVRGYEGLGATNDLARARLNLAQALGKRNRPGDRTQAADVFEMLLASTDPATDPWTWASAADDYGKLLANGPASAETLVQSARLHSEALAVYEQIGNHLDQSKARYSLAKTLVMHAERIMLPTPKHLALLTEAIAEYERAIEALRSHPAEGWRVSLERELAGLRASAAIHGGGHLADRRAEQVLEDESIELAGSGEAPTLVKCLARLGDLAGAREAWNECAHHYARAFSVAEAAYGGLDLSMRLRLIDVAGRYRERAAFALVTQGQEQAAADLLETWSQRFTSALDLNRSAAPSLDESAARTRERMRALVLRSIAGRLEAGGPTDIHTSAVEYRELAAALSGDEDSEPTDPRPPDGAWSPDVALIYLATSPWGTAVLSVESAPTAPSVSAALVKEVTEVGLLGGFTLSEWQALALPWLGLYERDDIGSHLPSVLEYLTPLATCVAQMAGNRKRLVLLGGGLMANVPLQAAIPEQSGEPLCTWYDVSRSPSRTQWRGNVSAANVHGSTAPHFAFLGSPPSELAFAHAEIAHLQALGAARLDLHHRPGDAAYVHVSGHAQFDSGNPFSSTLELDDRVISLADLVDRSDLDGARLVSLAACQTAIADPGIARSESIGFPAALTSRGIPGVVGTLWAVGDLCAAVLMTKYVDELAAWPTWDTGSASEALGQALSWMRNVSASELLSWLDSHAHLSDAVKKHPRLARDLRRMAASPTAKPFEHPVHWGAFTYTGA